jgi:hypothetical protein
MFADARECLLRYIMSSRVSSFLRLHTREFNRFRFRFRFAGARFIASALDFFLYGTYTLGYGKGFGKYYPYVRDSCLQLPFSSFNDDA